MDGVPQVIDTIGGVKVDIPEDIYQYHSNEIFKYKGEYVLNGQEFLYYARYREYSDGDIGRVATQQRLLKALFEQMTSSESIMKLPKAISQTFDIIMTDISFKQMTTLAFTLKDFNTDNIKTATMPGTFGNLHSLSYWIISQSQRVTFVKEYFGLSISPSTQDPTYLP
jgi:anionic cell wall polymer biosynthesis LytR-Cps2A-Psr (LCP) family protein